MSTNNNINKTFPLDVADGGTGNTVFDNRAVLAGGTTSTGNLQNIDPVSTIGINALTSQGASSLPIFLILPYIIIAQQNTLLNTTFSTSSTTYTDLTGLSVTITPSDGNSLVLLFGSISCAASGNGIAFQLLNGSTPIGIGNSAGSRTQCTSAMGFQHATNDTNTIRFCYLDSPASTSAVTYKIQMLVPSGTGYINQSSGDANSSSGKRAISTIFAMEVF